MIENLVEIGNLNYKHDWTLILHVQISKYPGNMYFVLFELKNHIWRRNLEISHFFFKDCHTKCTLLHEREQSATFESFNSFSFTVIPMQSMNFLAVFSFIQLS